MSTNSQHVVLRGGKWAVRRSGASKASATFATQREAIERGRALARRHHTELYIHGPDGRIRARDSYGGDPLHPEG